MVPERRRVKFKAGKVMAARVGNGVLAGAMNTAATVATGSTATGG